MMKFKFIIPNRHNLNKSLPGISIVELLLAMGIFMVFFAGGMGFVVMGQKSALMQNDYYKAQLIYKEAENVVNYLKKNSFSSLADGNYGIRFVSGNWEFIPNFDLVENKYRRVINVGPVYRDDDNNIVTGPTLLTDPDMKKITITISWTNGTINRSISQTRYLAHWEQSVPKLYGGMMAYADFSGNDDVIKYKYFRANGTWSTEKTVPDFDVPENQDTRRVEIYASPTRNEYILMTKHTENGQFIYAQVFKDDAWGNVIQLSDYGDNTNPNTRNFDGAYLEDGRFIAVFDDFTYTPKYRIWNGTSWSSQGSTGSLGFLGYPVWMQIRARPGDNRAIFVVRDAWQRTTSFLFNGTSFTNQTVHGSSNSGFTIENISITWNRHNENKFALMFNETSDNNPNIRLWNNSTSTWSSNVENVGLGSRARIFEIADHPTSDNYIGCVKAGSLAVQCLTSNDTPSWSNLYQLTSRTNPNEARSFSVGYEAQSGDIALVVYAGGSDDSAQKFPKYRTYNQSSNSWSDERSMSNLGPDGSNAVATVRVIPYPKSDDMFVLMADNSLDMYTVLWNGDDDEFSNRPGSNLKKHGIYGSNTEDFWYSFAWQLYEE